MRTFEASGVHCKRSAARFLEAAMLKRKRRWRVLALALLLAAALPASLAGEKPDAAALLSGEVTVVGSDKIVPPRVAPACKPGHCPFAGQSVTVLAARSVIARSLPELKAEFEAATGATLNIVQVPIKEHLDYFLSDAINRTGKYDASIVGAWWLGELVTGDHIVSYDAYYGDPRFPQWDIGEVLPAPRRLLEYGGKKYMVANDHDGQILYYRRDLFADPQHRAAFRERYGYPLAVPRTSEQVRDIAEYFNGRDLNGDRVPDHGLTMPLKAGYQAMFHFMSLSAPFVIGPDNPQLYWFDPQTMKPLIESPGHVQALKALVDLVQFGPGDMINWTHGTSWDHFLAGRAALTIAWGDVGALAQQEGSKIKGRIGAAPIPGTHAYYSIARGKWIETAEPNIVGNTIGGSWAGVISKYSKAPEAAYYLLALMASKEKSAIYAVRGWDGIDPGRAYHFLPPEGSAKIDDYLKVGWNETDVREYLQAYFGSFSNTLQFPYLRIPGAYSYWQSLDLHLVDAVAGRSTPEAALRATAVDFEEITIRLGRERQRRAYRASLGL